MERGEMERDRERDRENGKRREIGTRRNNTPTNLTSPP
jgi:hypothetical protein